MFLFKILREYLTAAASMYHFSAFIETDRLGSLGYKLLLSVTYTCTRKGRSLDLGISKNAKFI